jgi:hypothetical protein
MFECWLQHFSKYMREKFVLEVLIDYQIEPLGGAGSTSPSISDCLVRREARDVAEGSSGSIVQ